MMTTKKRRRFQHSIVVVAAVATFLTACGPPGAHELREGEQDLKEGQFADAIVVLREATRILTEAPPTEQAKAWNLLGLACQESGQLDAASKAYLQALKLDRNNAAIDYNLGCLRSQQADYPAATNYLTTYITLRPKDVQGYLQRGRAYYHYAQEPTSKDQRRLLEKARLDFESADKIHATGEAANGLGMLKLQGRSPGSEAIRAAETYFEFALKRDPHYAPALLNLATIQSQPYLNNPRKALALYREYLAIRPPPPHVEEVAKLAHDLDLSQRIIITPVPAPNRIPAPSAATRPNPPAARVNVAPTNPVAIMPKPRPAEAPPAQAVAPTPAPVPRPAPPPVAVSVVPTNTIADTPNPSPVQTPSAQPTNATPAPAAISEQVPLDTSSNPKTTNAAPEPVVTDTNATPRKTIIQRLNPLRLFSGKTKPHEEAATTNTAITPEPTPVPAGSRFEYPPPVTLIPGNRAQAKLLVAEAVQARQAGDWAQCIRAYKDAVAADPTFYDACHGLGLAAIDVRDYTTALQELHRALALREDSAEDRYAFAWTLQRRGYTEDAVHELGKLLDKHSDDVRGHLMLGSLYAEKLKQPKLAREQYTQALELDPNNAQAANVRAWLRSN